MDDVLACPGIRVRGLMTMAPKADPDCARRTFSGLRELAGELRGRTGLALPVLSCGMSDTANGREQNKTASEIKSSI